MKRYIKRILVPIEGSEFSKKALEMAIVIAKSSGAFLTILEVIEDSGPFPSYYLSVPDNVDRIQWISEQRFEKLHPMLEEEQVAWERIVVEGDPPEKICSFADEGAYDLIVIGNRSQSPLGRLLFGSVSDQIVHHTRASVLVVK